MLLALPKVGRVKATKIMNNCRVSPNKTLGGLSDRQRAELAERLNRRAPEPVGAGGASSVALTEAGFTIDRSVSVPDFVAQGPRGEFSIEATTVNPTVDAQGQPIAMPLPETAEQQLSYVREYLLSGTPVR
jgi:hypothetical protein